MRVLIFEHGIFGHYLAYARRLIDAAIPLADEVVLAAQQGLETSQEFQTHIQPILKDITLDASYPPITGGAWSNALRRPLMLRQAVSKHNPNILWVPFADGITQVAGLYRLFGLRLWPSSVRAIGLVMRGNYAYPQSSRLASVRSQLGYHLTRLSPWTNLFCIDPLQYDYILRRGGSLARRAVAMPDPVPKEDGAMSRVQARKFLSLEPSGRYVGCFGMLDERKGVGLLLNAFRDACPKPDDRLLLMGKASEGVRDMVRMQFSNDTKSGRIVLIDRYVSNEELSAGLAASDLVCTPYPRHIGSASIVIRAAAAGRLG